MWDVCQTAVFEDWWYELSEQEQDDVTDVVEPAYVVDTGHRKPRQLGPGLAQFFLRLVAAAPFGPQGISTAGSSSRGIIVVAIAGARLQVSSGITAIVAAAEVVILVLEGFGLSGWCAETRRALVGLLLRLAMELPGV